MYSMESIGGASMPDHEFERRISVLRAFNRFYTRQIGLLREGYLDSEFSLPQVRVLFELANHERLTASELAQELCLDRAYLSRLLRDMRGLDLVQQTTSKVDARRRILSLTPHGREVFVPLNQRAHDDIGAQLQALVPGEQERVVEAMQTIESLLGDRHEPKVPYVLRPPGPGDMGWVVQRHGAIYSQEYDWDETFEALVAEIVASFIRNYDRKRERCWIAEIGGTNVGSVFCVKKSDTVAQLRLLLVEREARGLGIGRRLVDECVRFARSIGCSTLTLWTNDVLVAARRIYETAGFHLVEQEQHHSFGHDLIGQNWELDL